MTKKIHFPFFAVFRPNSFSNKPTVRKSQPWSSLLYPPSTPPHPIQPILGASTWRIPPQMNLRRWTFKVLGYTSIVHNLLSLVYIHVIHASCMYIFVYNQNFFNNTLSFFQIVTWCQRLRVLKAGEYCLKLSLVIILFVLVAAVFFFFWQCPFSLSHHWWKSHCSEKARERLDPWLEDEGGYKLAFVEFFQPENILENIEIAKVQNTPITLSCFQDLCDLSQCTVG